MTARAPAALDHPAPHVVGCDVALRILGATTFDELAEVCRSAVVDLLPECHPSVIFCGPSGETATGTSAGEAGLDDVLPWLEPLGARQGSSAALRESSAGVSVGLRLGTEWVGAIRASGFEPRDSDARRNALLELARLVAAGGAVLSERLAAAQLLAAQRAIVSQACHDLRTPLGNVKLGVQLLRMATADGNATADRIDRGISRMTTLLDELTERAGSRASD
jgi:signal transduction histidine kinase